MTLFKTKKSQIDEIALKDSFVIIPIDQWIFYFYDL
jgi:hypothetical protein